MLIGATGGRLDVDRNVRQATFTVSRFFLMSCRESCLGRLTPDMTCREKSENCLQSPTRQTDASVQNHSLGAIPLIFSGHSSASQDMARKKSRYLADRRSLARGPEGSLKAAIERAVSCLKYHYFTTLPKWVALLTFPPSLAIDGVRSQIDLVRTTSKKSRCEKRPFMSIMCLGRCTDEGIRGRGFSIDQRRG